MLLKQETLKGIENGSISLVFRRWRRPTVRTGGRLLTSVGQLAMEAVDMVDLEGITEAEAMAAGFVDLEALRSRLLLRAEGDVYRVRLSVVGPDPRIALRDEIPEGAELEEVLQRLARLDSRGALGSWTFRFLELIRERPGERATDLARDFGMDRVKFKANVRKLKALGLTESLKVGYRLSPRGDAVLRKLRDGRDELG
jgi:DNA-binding MarR family transcriptional regulator